MYSSRFVGLDEFVTADKTSLLNRNANSNKDTEYCEIDFNINSKYELDSFSLVSDCDKMEIFNGSIKEFYKICYGTIIDDFEETKSYRFDIVCKKLSNKLTLRVKKHLKTVTTIKISNFTIFLQFITKNDIIWIFGIQLQLQESNRKPSNTNNMFDLEAIQNMLVDCKPDVSRNSDKCKLLFDSFLNNSSKKPQIGEINELKKHIDSKLLELEKNLTKTINERINKIECDISEKLNNILDLIKKQ